MKKGENYNGPKVGSKTVVYPIRRMKDIGVHLFQPTSGEWKFETVVTKGSVTYGGQEMPSTTRSYVISAQGTMFYSNGRKEVGEFKNDEFHKK